MVDRENRTRNPFQSVLVLVTVCVVFFYIYARQAAEQIMFQPPAPTYERLDEFERVAAADGTSLNFYWAEGGGSGWTVLYFYGSDEDAGMALPRLTSYLLRGFNVACYDYRGYGYTEGTPTETALCDDAETIYDYLLREKGIAESKLVLHGRFIGAGVAMELATRRKPAGLILESTFTSVYSMLLPLQWIPGDSFENARKADQVECPVLLIHGAEDSTVPLTHCQTLEAAFGPDQAVSFHVPGAGHRDVAERGGVAYWTSIERFVRGLQ